MNFATLKGLTIPEGVVKKIECDGVVLWKVDECELYGHDWNEENRIDPTCTDEG